MQRLLLLALTILLTFAAIGCEKSQTVKDSWKFTTRQYRTYLNTPASVDLEDKGSCEVYELALGEAVLSMDLELQKLIRAMENSDHNPDQRWVMSMMHRFPWLSGVALAEGSGEIVARYPEYYAKTFEIGPLLEADPKQRPGALRAYAHPDGSGGAEVYLANPVFGGEAMRGIIIAHFDIRALATMSADPGSFIIASPVGVLWPGRFSAEGTAVAGTDWAKLLTEKSCGIVGSEGSSFFWTTRYLGNLPLVYAMPTSAGPTEAPAVDSGTASAPSSDGDSTPLQESAPASVTSSPPSDPMSPPPANMPQNPVEPPVEDGPPSSAAL